MITITDASGQIRSQDWPPSEKPEMLEQVAEQKRKAAQDAYQAWKEANGGLKSYSYRGTPSMGKIQRIDNNSGTTEWVDV